MGQEAIPDAAPRHGHTAFFAGTLHGVAGTAHLLGVLAGAGAPGMVGLPAPTCWPLPRARSAAMAAFAAVVGESSAQDRPRPRTSSAGALCGQPRDRGGGGGVDRPFDGGLASARDRLKAQG